MSDPTLGEAKDAGFVAVAAGEPFARFILRGNDEARIAAGAGFGLDLPAKINRAAAREGRAALKLGPDEWLLLAPPAESGAVEAALGEALAARPSSLVDVTHRQIGFTVAGPGAARLLSGAVPLDLDATAFPVGMATRTLLDKAEITLWRLEAGRFHLEAARSFAPYVAALLEELRFENA